MAGKGFTGGRRVNGALWRRNFENIDFSGRMSRQEAVEILGLTDEDFIPLEEQLTIGEPLTQQDMTTALRYIQAIEEGKESSEWQITPPAY